MGNAANVLVGPGDLYEAPVGTTPPVTTGDTLTWPSPWRNVGYTDGGLELEYTPEIFDAEVDQELAPVKSELSKESLLVRASLAESTLKNLNFAITGSTFSQQASGLGQVAYDQLVAGSGTLTERMLGFQGKAPSGKWRLVLIWRAVSAGAVGHAYRKAEKTLIPVELRAYADSAKPAGERLFRFRDWTAAAS